LGLVDPGLLGEPFEGGQYMTSHMGLQFDIAQDGELYMMSQGAGGGYGDVLERDPQAVVSDVELNRITHKVAREIFAVAYDPKTLVLDVEGTKTLLSPRGLRRSATSSPAAATAPPSSAWIRRPPSSGRRGPTESPCGSWTTTTPSWPPSIPTRGTTSRPAWPLASETIFQAVGQALHTTTATRQSRKGEISTWKAHAPAFAAKMAVEAVDRAIRGQTSPTPIYEGEDGVISWLLDGPDASHEVPLPGPGGAKLAILDSYTKEHHRRAADDGASDGRLPHRRLSAGAGDSQAGDSSREANLERSVRLWMTFGEEAAPDVAEAFKVSMVLYAEHSFNASTFTARVVTSTLSDLHSAVIAAIGALKGPLHGGANEAVMHSFEEIMASANSGGHKTAQVREC
jgi:hypothetical protein